MQSVGAACAGPGRPCSLSPINLATYNDTRMGKWKPAHGVTGIGSAKPSFHLPLQKSAGMLLRVLAVAAVAGFIGAGLPSLSRAQQDSQDSQQPTFTLKENVHLVIVPVTVKDRQGALIDDLIQDDFNVFEDGHARPIRYFSNETTPLSAVILIDTGMSGLAVEAVRSGLRNMDESFAPNDKEALILFDNTLRPVADFSTPGGASAVLAAAEDALPAGTGSAAAVAGGPLGGPLNTPPVINGVPGTAPSSAPRVGKRIDDALFAAIQQLRGRPLLESRRVILILSDGVNGSDNQIHHNEVMEALAVSQVTVYAVSFGSGWAAKRTDLLARTAYETGGDIAYAQRKSHLDRVVPELTNQARNSYVLGFEPVSADGRFHEIRVRVRRRGTRTIARNRFLSIPNR